MSGGWLFADKPISPGVGDDDDWHGSLFGGASVGWYWTDHLKTEVDVGAHTPITAYRYRKITIEGRPNFVASELTFATRSIGLSQQYQFQRNAWFHPHVAGGVDLRWARSTELFQPVRTFDSPTREQVLIPGRTEGPRTTTTLRPFVATGFKAYMTQKSFFRSDFRIGVGSRGTDQAVLRFGFGLDF